MASDPQVAAIEARLLAAIAEARNALALEITANLQDRCPVDTGHARANFVPSLAAPFAGEAQDGGAQAAGVAQVLGAKLSDDVFVANNVPYIGRLIGGSSSQAPAGWDVEAIDQAVQTIQSRYDALQIEVSDGGASASATIKARGQGAG